MLACAHLLWDEGLVALPPRSVSAARQGEHVGAREGGQEEEPLQPPRRREHVVGRGAEGVRNSRFRFQFCQGAFELVNIFAMISRMM